MCDLGLPFPEECTVLFQYNLISFDEGYESPTVDVTLNEWEIYDL